MAHTRFRFAGLPHVISALSLAVCAAALSGCSSGDDGPSSEPSGDDPSAGEQPTDTPADATDDSAFSITTSGEIALDTGHARLTVQENVDHATLEIVATSESDDSMLLYLTFPRDAGIFGQHVTALALPRESDNVAHVLLGAAPEAYRFSRSGEVDLTLTREGHTLSGTFDIAVTEATALSSGVYEPFGDTTPLTGSFTGTYEVRCYSVLAGHSVAVQANGEFCEALDL
jgi:hypothetical protein